MNTETSFPDDRPFAITYPDEGRAVIQFAPICDHDRTPQLEAEFLSVIRQCDQVVCDLAQTKQIVSAWIRIIERMTSDASKMGKSVVVAAGNDHIVHEIADVQGIGGRLEFVASVEEAWTE